MSAGQRAYLHSSVVTAISLLRWSSVVLVLSLALRFFYQPRAGQALSIVGAVLYFVSSWVFSVSTGNAFAKIQTYQEIVAEFIKLGFVALMPGTVLVARDLFARVLRHIQSRRLLMSADKKKRHRRGIYEMCWQMPICPEYIRQYCPAANNKKPCWQMKSGCLCEGSGAYRAMAVKSTDDTFARFMMKELDEDRQRASEMTPTQKRNRCKRCIIFAEHQRQKYWIVSTLVFPAVGLLFWASYGRLSSVVWRFLEGADRFMCFLAYDPGKTVSFASQGQALTTLALLCLGVMVLSYALRAVEYFIFDLQV
jgi:hypothetical protein